MTNICILYFTLINLFIGCLKGGTKITFSLYVTCNIHSIVIINVYYEKAELNNTGADFTDIRLWFSEQRVEQSSKLGGQNRFCVMYQIKYIDMNIKELQM